MSEYTTLLSPSLTFPTLLLTLPQTTLKVIDPKSALFGQRVTGVVPRRTVYEVAAQAGFPSELGLAGRLDFHTSGIMLMSDDSRLLNGVIRPPHEDEEEKEEGDGDGDGDGEEGGGE